MVTRSDPGGSVPRFMVEKGTPGGIVNDAGRFFNWVSSKKHEDFTLAAANVLEDTATAVQTLTMKDEESTDLEVRTRLIQPWRRYSNKRSGWASS